MENTITLHKRLVSTPGEPVISDVKISSPFVIDNGEQSGLGTILIEVSKYKTEDLFPPTVLAYHGETKNIVNVDALVLLPIRKFEPNKFQVTQQFTYAEDGRNQLNLFISYFSDEIPVNKYLPIRVSFKTNPVDIDGVPVHIDTTQTFFKNRDPRTSRGTVTTVKRPM